MFFRNGKTSSLSGTLRNGAILQVSELTHRHCGSLTFCYITRKCKWKKVILDFHNFEKINWYKLFWKGSRGITFKYKINKLVKYLGFPVNKPCIIDPAGIYLFKVNNRNTRIMYEICSNLMSPEWCLSGV